MAHSPPIADETVGVCVIRVSSDHNSLGFRARITAVRDVNAPAEEITLTTDRQQVVNTVVRFLDEQGWVDAVTGL